LKLSQFKCCIVELAWLFFMAGLLISIAPFLDQPFEEMGDIALISRQVAQASEFEVLRGAYSRLGFFHIGPISFYWMALVQWVLPSGLFAEGSFYYQYALGIWLANTLMGLALFVSLRKLGLDTLSRILVLVFTIVLLWHLGGHVYFSPWGPHLTIIPMLWFTANLVRAGQKDYKSLPGLAFAAIWILHSHAGSLIFLGPSCLLLLYFWIRLYRRNELELRSLYVPLLVGSVILIAGLAIPVYEAWLNQGGNIQAIANYLAENSTWRKPGKALVFMLSAMDGPFSVGFPLFAPIALMLFVFYSRKKIDVTKKRLLLVSLIVVVGSFYGALRTPGSLVPHLFDHLLTINALILAVAIAPAIRSLGLQLPGLDSMLRNPGISGKPSISETGESSRSEIGERASETDSASPSGTEHTRFEVDSAETTSEAVPALQKKTHPVAGLAIILVFLFTGMSRDTRAPSDSFQASQILEQLQAQPNLTLDANSLYRIHFATEDLAHWPRAAGLMLQMERRGLRACIEPPYDILFGPEALCPKEIEKTILIEPASKNPKMKHDRSVYYGEIRATYYEQYEVHAGK
tara:strand:+ start:81598 stop:83322 length:1725 start_codon:yes stop_codon:yes gene_type:complete